MNWGYSLFPPYYLPLFSLKTSAKRFGSLRELSYIYTVNDDDDYDKDNSKDNSVSVFNLHN